MTLTDLTTHPAETELPPGQLARLRLRTDLRAGKPKNDGCYLPNIECRSGFVVEKDLSACTQKCVDPMAGYTGGND